MGTGCETVELAVAGLPRVREKVTSLASRLPLAEWRRLFSTESRLSRSVCKSGASGQRSGRRRGRTG